jgi:hypothetical protein
VDGGFINDFKQATQLFKAEGDFSFGKNRNFNQNANSKENPINKEDSFILAQQTFLCFRTNKNATYCNHLNYLSHTILIAFLHQR